MEQHKRSIMVILVVLSSVAFAENSPTQNWVEGWLARFSPNPTIPLLNTFIRWESLCRGGEIIDDANGCTPDCNTPLTAPTCNTIFNIAQTEELTNIPLPYLANGVVLFRIPQQNISSTAVFNVVVGQTPHNYGYMCQMLNSNATPAYIWDTTTKAFTSIITMDYHVTAPFKSDNFINTVAQGTNGGGYWYSNQNNPLYMMCLGYQVINGSNYLQSNTTCGGNTGECVSYTLQ